MLCLPGLLQGRIIVGMENNESSAHDPLDARLAN
jgi:hypothetical protein